MIIIILCRSCGKPIVWKKTLSGKNIPVDYDPKMDPYQDIFDHKTMVAHFVTCPDAKKWRRR